jgi:hypothetical protein
VPLTVDDPGSLPIYEQYNASRHKGVVDRAGSGHAAQQQQWFAESRVIESSSGKLVYGLRIHYGPCLCKTLGF